jgi:hypothetical protein
MAKVRISHFILAAMAAIWFVGENAVASESTNWLLHDSVSMMDWGSVKAEKSAQNAVDQLNRLMEGREKQVGMSIIDGLELDELQDKLAAWVARLAMRRSRRL